MKSIATFRINCILACSIILFTFASCEKDDVKIPEGQQAYFEYYFYNYAWTGKVHGFLIDKDGRILMYEQPRQKEGNINWNFPENDYITALKMQENLAKAKPHTMKISSDELEKYTQKIYSIKEGNYTERKAVAADAGIHAIICYKYDSKSQKYKSILLKEWGDTEQLNKDLDAIILVQWLEKINTDLLLSSYRPF